MTCKDCKKYRHCVERRGVCSAFKKRRRKSEADRVAESFCWMSIVSVVAMTVVYILQAGPI